MSIPTPGVIDPFAGTPSPGEMQQRADGSIIVPPTDPYHGVVAELLTTEGAYKLTRAYDALANLQQTQEQLQAAKAVLPALEQQAALVPTLQAQVSQLQAQITVLAESASKAQAQAQPTPAVDEDRGPIPGALIYPVDPFYTPAGWSQPLRDRLDNDSCVNALIGPAGVGKTKCAIEHAALRKVPLVYLNCKGSDPNEWFEYRSVENGETKWTDGKLTAVIRHGAPCWILIDEPDTSSADFQMRLASVLEADPRQRQVVTPYGTFAVPSCIKFILAMNGNGTNPSSRHRGTLTAALQNRVTWVRAPLVQAQELDAILARARPTLTPADRADIAECVVRLMSAADRGEIDVDASIRTAFKVADGLKYGQQIAWNGAILDGLDDPAMRAKAIAILADRFTLN